VIGKKITIIGGSGGMGQIFAKIFKKNKFQVTITARNEERLKKIANQLEIKYKTNLHESVEDADLVMISIPISSTIQMIKEVVPLMKKNALLFEITSLKSHVYRTLEKACKTYPISCISLHPMFGPGIESLENYNLISLRVGGTSNYDLIIKEFLDIFRKEGLQIISVEDPKYHDRIMALVLGVPHMFNILFLSLLNHSEINLNELMKFTGTTFLLQTIFAESIIQREKEMFGEIQMKNSEFHSILDHFEIIIKNYKEIIKNQDINKFKNLFTNGEKYSKNEEHFDNSYRYFYEFLKILKKNEKNKKDSI
jgi:prephenate dehydrogenase